MAELEIDLKRTEDPEKVMQAVRNIFPEANLLIEGDRITGDADIDDFWERVDELQIRGAVEAELDANEENGRSFIDLSKMAAVAGKISIDQGFALGKIKVSLEWQKNK